MPSLGQPPIEDEGDPTKMAEFRDLARRMLTSIKPLCQLTASTSVSDEEVLRPASEAVARFKKELAATRFSGHFGVAEADVAYLISNTVVECAQPSAAEPKQMSLEIAAQAEEQIAAIRKIVKGS